MIRLWFEDELGDVVSKARRSLNLSVADLARLVGSEDTYIEALERYEETPDDALIAALAQVLQLSPKGLAALRDFSPPLEDTPHPQVERIHFPAFRSNGYVVTLGEKRLLIDPGDDTPELLAAVSEPPDAIFLTHDHHDHIGGLKRVVSVHPAPVYAMPESTIDVPFEALSDQDEVLGLTALKTPGHSPDGVTFAAEGIAFTGDCLFARSMGRAKRPADYPALLQSGRRIVSLEQETRLFPGHGGSTTVAEELTFNPFLAS